MRPFRGKEEFRKVFDRLFLALASDPEIGPKLAATKTPQRFVFSDAGLVLNVTHADRKTGISCGSGATRSARGSPSSA